MMKNKWIVCALLPALFLLLLEASAADRPQAPTTSTMRVSATAEWDDFLQSVRAKAIRYTDELPDFICTQSVNRSARTAYGGSIPVDGIVAEVSFYNQREQHKILKAGKIKDFYKAFIGSAPPENWHSGARIEGLNIIKFAGYRKFGTQVKMVY